MLTTPPTSAKGRFTIIMVESGTLLNSWNREHEDYEDGEQ